MFFAQMYNFQNKNLLGTKMK